MINRIVAGVGQLAIRAEHLHRHLLHALIHLAPEYFLNRAFGAGHAGLAHARQRAHLVQAEDFGLGIHLRQLLANDRIPACRLAIVRKLF